jgi:hypothetical protein
MLIKDLLTMRIFYVKSAITSGTTDDNIYACVNNALGQQIVPTPAFTILPVKGLRERALIMISCWFQY